MFTLFIPNHEINIEKNFYRKKFNKCQQIEMIAKLVTRIINICIACINLLGSTPLR